MKNQLKEKILEANKAYRNGYPIMDDQTFDDLVEQYEKLVSKDEFNSFRDSLHEKSGKVIHPFIMGSLDKLKYEEPETIEKFIKSKIKTKLNISSKIDGISCRLYYKNGKLVEASTRGDGTKGENISDKIKYVRYVPTRIDTTIPELHIRGELVILNEDFSRLTGFANARNACAGLINRKEFDEEDIENVSFIAYTILGDTYTKSEQFNILEKLDFNVAWHTDITLENVENISNKLFEYATQEFAYETDGLVICDSTYKNELRYRPDNCVAFKINQLAGETTLIDVVFEGPSKDGNHIPVAIFEPIELGGSVISRATLHNLDFIAEKNLKYGSKIKIIKSGDVIPKVIEVTENNEDCTEIELPLICNCCQQPLVRDGVNLRCFNENCKDQIIYQITHFIKKLDVKSASFKTLDNFGIHSFDKLIEFKANPKYKSEVKLYEELYDKVFSKSKKDLLAALNFNGLSEILINKIIDFYGYKSIEDFSFTENNNLPEGVGVILIDKFQMGLQKNLDIINKIVNSSKYHYIEQEHLIDKISNKNGMSICFTGKLNTMGRTEASKLATAQGYEVKSSVTKGLTYLVNNDVNSGSSKNKKALQLGIKIINEDEFLKLISNVENDNNIFYL